MPKGDWNKRTTQEVEKIVNNYGYVLLGEYVEKRYDRRVVIRDEFGYKYDVRLTSLTNTNQGLCLVDPRRSDISLENISLWLKREGKPFELCDGNKYNGAKEKLTFHCLVPECNNYFYIRWDNIFSGGQGCQYCCGRLVTDKNRLSIHFLSVSSEWDYNLNEDTPDDVAYASNKTRWWKCPKGHQSYPATVNSRTNMGSGCPRCSFSKGEDVVSEWLDNNNIKYVPQKSFDECRNKNPLEFDFGIPYEDETWFLIEYHGPQHYGPVDFAGRGIEWAKSEFKKNRKRDKIKAKYCKDNGIPLLVIPYWDFDNIESILSEALGL